jgi:hypothetical protein
LYRSEGEKMDGWRDVHTGCHLYLDSVCVPWLVSLFPVPESFMRQGGKDKKGKGGEARRSGWL